MKIIIIIIIIILFIYFHENYFYLLMFRNVPECSMFRFLSTPVYKFAEAARYLKFKWEFVIIGRGCLLKVQVKFVLADAVF